MGNRSGSVVAAAGASSSGGGSGGGSSAPVVNIYNNNGSEVTQTSKSDGNGGIQLDVMIDNAVGKKLSTFGSKSNRALRNTYGAKGQLVSR